MPTLTIRNLPDEVHRALRLRATQHGRSTEAEVRAILIEAAKPQSRLKLGSMLADIGRRMKISDDEFALLNQRDRSAPRDVDNVICEPLRTTPEQRVVAWLDAQPLETLYLSVITVAELRYGVARLPSGRRRKLLAEQLETRVLPTFAGRVLAFDLPATQAYADLMARAQATGQPISMADGLIAAIAMTNRMIVATRDAKPFAAVGVSVIDPWQLT